MWLWFVVMFVVCGNVCGLCNVVVVCGNVFVVCGNVMWFVRNCGLW